MSNLKAQLEDLATDLFVNGEHLTLSDAIVRIRALAAPIPTLDIEADHHTDPINGIRHPGPGIAGCIYCINILHQAMDLNRKEAFS